MEADEPILQTVEKDLVGAEDGGWSLTRDQRQNVRLETTLA